MHDRMRRLEEQQVTSSRERDAKERKMLELQQENARLAQQALDARKHSHEMAELIKAHASTPRAVNSPFDMTPLEKVIREVQAAQISPSDIQDLVKAQLSVELKGLAKKEDLDSAARQMQKALEKFPAGVSETQIGPAISGELSKAYERLVSRMPAQQQRLREAHNADIPWQQPQPPRFETHFEIQELPVDRGSNEAHAALQAAIGSTDSLASQRQVKHVPVHTAKKLSGTPLTESAFARLKGPEKQSSSKSHHSASRPPASVTPAPNNPVARIKGSTTKSSKKSTLSVQPSAENAIMPSSSSGGALGYQSSAHTMAAAQGQGAQLARSQHGTHVAYEDVPHDMPDNASRVTALMRQRASVGATRDQDTVYKIRSRNDGREEVATSARQLDCPGQQQAEDCGKQVARQSRNMAKKGSPR